MVSHMNLNHARLPISPHPHIKLFLIIEIALCVRHSAEPNGRFGKRHGVKRFASRKICYDVLADKTAFSTKLAKKIKMEESVCLIRSKARVIILHFCVLRNCLHKNCAYFVLTISTPHIFTVRRACGCAVFVGK